MTQFPLPLAWPADARDAEFLVSSSNADAVRLLERWAAWPVRTALLVGPPQSGRSLLARIFAAQSGGQVIDDALAQPEEALFHAWNRAQAGMRPLLLVADAAPPGWAVTLPDLRSRLAACPVAAIGAPDDALVAALFERGFERRRVPVRDDVVAWLAARAERRHAAVMASVDTLADAALAQGRRLSIPLARATLEAQATLTERSDTRT
jgi:chromosomal replication initiation ATPase DnaA